MSDKKYTPGPWEVFDDGMREYGIKAVTSPHGTGLDFVICDDVRGDYRDNQTGGSPSANAALIAAAPELLEALEEVVKELYELSRDECDDPSVGIFGWNDINERMIPNALKAIAKAKGEHQ